MEQTYPQAVAQLCLNFTENSSCWHTGADPSNLKVTPPVVSLHPTFNVRSVSNNQVLSLMERFHAANALIKSRKENYGRKEACSLVGFHGKSPAFTFWLKDNSFLSDDDYPHQLLLDDKIMAVREKEICHGTKIVYTPLFTYAGIRYFTRILLEPTFLYEQKLKLDEHTKMSYNGPRLI